MGHRQDVLLQLGYDVHYEQRQRYQGSSDTKICLAAKDSVRYRAFHVSDPNHFHRVAAIQESIPHMARMVVVPGNVVLLEEIHGELLWHLNRLQDIIGIEEQLSAFADATKQQGLIHGDLRPWNIMIDDRGVQVIDWWTLSAFLDDLVPQGDQPSRRADLLGNGHYSQFHPDLVAQSRYTDIDQADASTIGKLLRGELALSDVAAWGGYYRNMEPFWRG